jgi:hypothetical protein
MDGYGKEADAALREAARPEAAELLLSRERIAKDLEFPAVRLSFLPKPDGLEV